MQITIEYMIMIPILILQIFLFPFTASLIMNTWVTSRESLALQEAASHLGSSIQQVYFSLNHDSISAGTLTSKSNIPPFIENYPYVGNASLATSLDSSLNSTKVLGITLNLIGAGVSTSTSVTLGQNVVWQNSTFLSNSTGAGIIAHKYPNGTIQLSFGT